MKERAKLCRVGCITFSAIIVVWVGLQIPVNGLEGRGDLARDRRDRNRRLALSALLLLLVLLSLLECFQRNAKLVSLLFPVRVDCIANLVDGVPLEVIGQERPTNLKQFTSVSVVL